METRKAAAEYRLRQWTVTLQEQKTSGMSITAWCEQHGIPRWKYFYWQRRTRTAAMTGGGKAVATRIGEELAPTFVAVTPAPEPQEGTIRICLKDVEVVIGGAAAPAAIEAVMRELRS